MGRDFSNFEKGLRESLEGYEVPYNEAQWNDLTQKMDGRKATWGSTLAASIVTALILAGGTYYFTSLNSEESISSKSNYELYDTNSANTSNSEIKLSDDRFNSESSLISENQISGLNNNSEVNALDPNQVEINKVNSNTVKTAFFDEENTFKHNTNAELETNQNQSKADSNQDHNSDTSLVNSEKGEEVQQTDFESVTIDSNGDEKENVPYMFVSQREACVGEVIKFKAENIDDGQNFLWNFGNGDFSTDLSPERTFDKADVYNVTLILSNTAKEVQSQITIHPIPKVEFAAKSSSPGEMTFKNESNETENSTWSIEDEYFSNETSPLYKYTRGGSVHVTLMVENEFGCSDTAHKDFLLTSPFVISNTPDEDSIYTS